MRRQYTGIAFSREYYNNDNDDNYHNKKYDYHSVQKIHRGERVDTQNRGPAEWSSDEGW